MNVHSLIIAKIDKLNLRASRGTYVWRASSAATDDEITETYARFKGIAQFSR